MMDHLARPTLAEGHVEGVENQLGSQVIGHRPADDPAAPDIHDDCQIEKARQGRDIGEILSANLSGACQSSETRYARPGTRAPGQPMHGARDVHCGGRTGLLQSALGQADVAASSHAEGAHAL